MKFNYLKLIALNVSSGLFISSIPTKAESLKTNYEVLNTNSLNNILIAETPIYRVIKKAIVRKNGYLKLKFVNPVESISGSVIVNSPSGSYEFFVKDAAISKKSITWKGGAENLFKNKNVLRVDTSKLTGIKFTGNIPGATINNKVLAFTSDSGALASSYGGVAGSAAVGGSAAAVVAPVVITGVSAAAILGGLVVAGIAVGAGSSGSGSSSSN